MDILANIDTAIFYFFNKTCHVAGLDKLVIFITDLGGGKLIFIAAICMLFFRKRRIRLSGILLLAGLTFSYYIVNTLKDLVARPRPFLVLADVNVLASTGDLSFPSGHASIAFMAALILTKCFGRWYIFYPLAVSVAMSRVYLGVHFPSDVIVGGCIGSVIGYILIRVVKLENQEA